jgi:hypothetical protein
MILRDDAISHNDVITDDVSTQPDRRDAPHPREYH